MCVGTGRAGQCSVFCVRVCSKGYFFEEILSMELYLFNTFDCEACFCPGDI